MAIHGFNLDQTRAFEEQIKSLRKKLSVDLDYKKNVMCNEGAYEKIKYFFMEHLKFLQYTFDVNIEYLYRVRKLENQDPFRAKSELLYPPACMQHKDRMNNMSSRVLYVSLHEFTAMAETRMDQCYVNNYFQLTKFSPNRKIKAFKLGQFSELYKDTPRDSELVNAKLVELFGSPHHDGTVQGYAALECAIADILYSQDDDYHILSSIMADAIFTVNSSIEAIIYPSVQNRYGTNFALKKELADKLDIRASFVNILKDVYSNGFFKYQTIMEYSGFDDDSLVFSDVRTTGHERYVYR